MPSAHLDYLHFFDWVWHTSASVSVLIIFLLVVKFVLKSKINARLHYLLWSFVIVSLLLPWTPQSSFSLYNFTNLDTLKTPFFNVGTKPSSRSASIGAGLADKETDNRFNEIVAQIPSKPSTNESLNSIITSLFTDRMLFYIWFMGIAIFIAVTTLVNSSFIQRIKGQSVLDLKLLTALTEAKNKLNIKDEVPLIQTMVITSPSLHGLFHPEILIPVGILEEFNPEQLNHVFVHELLHLKRKDVWVNWLIQGLLILHWFNPLLWYALFLFATFLALFHMFDKEDLT
ncbi:MAG: M56 family metallopeptidase [Desulfosporosinus sp.]|nr:M56 family metallopeptidase [Desulfosporosinus sp.]